MEFIIISLVVWGVGIPLVGMLTTYFRKSYFVRSYLEVTTLGDATLLSFMWPAFILAVLYIAVAMPLNAKLAASWKKLSARWEA